MRCHSPATSVKTAETRSAASIRPGVAQGAGPRRRRQSARRTSLARNMSGTSRSPGRTRTARPASIKTPSRAGSRFDISHVQGKLYRDRYWNDAYLDALAEIHRSCEGHGLDAVSVALRWLIHDSRLNAERNDGVIIGASSLEHLRHNLTAVTEGPLRTDVLTAIDDAALKA